MGSNLVTPLFPVYAKVYRLSPLGVSLLFATYALLVIPALLSFGPLSDVKGRRELLTGAIILAAVAAGLFAVATVLAMLFVAQAVQAMALPGRPATRRAGRTGPPRSPVRALLTGRLPATQTSHGHAGDGGPCCRAAVPPARILAEKCHPCDYACYRCS
jgi:MFS family permease